MRKTHITKAVESRYVIMNLDLNQRNSGWIIQLFHLEAFKSFNLTWRQWIASQSLHTHTHSHTHTHTLTLTHTLTRGQKKQRADYGTEWGEVGSLRSLTYILISSESWFTLACGDTACSTHLHWKTHGLQPLQGGRLWLFYFLSFLLYTFLLFFFFHFICFFFYYVIYLYSISPKISFKLFVFHFSFVFVLYYFTLFILII